MTDFPSSKYERGKIFATTGFKVGKNYAFHYLKSITQKNTPLSDLHRKTAEDIFGQFTKLRGTALKIAQMFSVDQGFLPDEFTEVMTQAQYSVPPINKPLVRSIIKRELGQYPEQIFSHFDTESIAAASIGQVHKATLKNGEAVAVKIQYPGVKDTIHSDITLARSLFKQIVRSSEDLDPYIEEVKKTLLRETDYIQEGEAISRFHQRFSNGYVITPKWYPDYSTERVLTMSFIKGVHLREFLNSSPSQAQINRYGQYMWDFFHEQVKSRGEVHADTHPGNFIFTENNKLGIIDFGCVKRFPESFFMDYLRLLPTHLKRDDYEIKKLYMKLNVLKDDPEKNKKEQRIFEFCKNYGFTFSMPYLNDTFDFGDAEYRELLRGYTKNAPFSNEPRGNKNFIYTTRIHLGLYHFLMKLGAVVNTDKSKSILENIFEEEVNN